jgi:flavodoxin I
MKNMMKSLIIYDSIYGNTEKIAKAIGDGLTGEVKVVRVSEVDTSELNTFDLLIIGSLLTQKIPSINGTSGLDLS